MYLHALVWSRMLENEKPCFSSHWVYVGHHEWIGASPVEDSPHMSQDLLSMDSSPPLPSLALARTSDESASVASPQPQPHQLQDGGSQEATVTTPPMPSVSFAAALRCSNKAAPLPLWPGRESTKTKVLSPTGEQERIQGHFLYQ